MIIPMGEGLSAKSGVYAGDHTGVISAFRVRRKYGFLDFLSDRGMNPIS